MANAFIAAIVMIVAVLLALYYKPIGEEDSARESRAWLTLIANDEYVPGALALTR